MKNKEKTELIPELRFGGFPIKNWDEKKLQDIFIYLSTNTYSRNLLNNRQGIYQNIHYGDILVKYGSIIDAQKEEIPYINEDIECITDNIIMDGDIVIADTAEDEIVGKTSEIFNIGDKKILSGLHTFWLRPLISFAPKYLGYFFNSTQYHNQLLPLIQGAKVSSISKKALNNTIIVYPSTSEQQKIADCLSSLDELIEATAQKVDALKEHKKGLMQRLFPAEGKNVPDLRFPEFQGTSVWEEKKLGNVVEIKGRIGFRGYTTKDIVEQGKGAISLSPTNITENGNLNFDKSTYISWEKYNESPEIQLQKGHIVLVKTGSSYGKSALVKELPAKTTVNPQIVVLKPEEGVNKYFISVLISHPMIQKQIKCAVVGGAIPTLSQESISKFDVLYPKKTSYKPSEQEKIANCLSSLDELIEATSRKVEILKEHKKGLMQQLFPKI